MKYQKPVKLISILCTGALLLIMVGCSQPGYIRKNDFLVAEGQLDTAIANYRQLIIEDPHDSERYYQLAKILFQKGVYPEAIKTIEKAIIIDHLIDRYQLLAGKIKFAAHDHFEAINHLTNSLVLNPQYLEAYYYLALALEKTGQTGRALEQLQAAISIEPLYFDAHLAWVEIRFHQLTRSGPVPTSQPTGTAIEPAAGATAPSGATTGTGQSEESLNAFLQLTEKLENALIIKPDSVPGNLLLSKIYYSLGAEYKARLILENWLREYGQNDRILLALARIEYQSGRFDQAEKVLSKQQQPDLEAQVLGLKIELRKGGTPEMAGKIDRLLQQFPGSDVLVLLSAQWELKQENIIRAERLIQKSLEINPDYAEAYFTLSEIHEAQNDTVGAQWALRKALQLAPTNLEIKLRYLRGLVEQGNWYEAEELLKLYTLDSDHPEVIFLKGVIAKEKGNYHEAETLFLNAQKKQYSVKIETQLADLEIRQGQYYAAETRLRRIGALTPNNLDIALARASLMLQKKESAEITPLLTPYLPHKQGRGRVHLLLAESLIQQGKTEAVLPILADALNRWPRNPDIVQAYTLYLGIANNQKAAIPLLEDMQTFVHKFNQLFYFRLRAFYFRAGEMDKFKNYIHRYR
ncbi:MAG: tetratricopeptide repeat protein, partial [bacterium]